MVAGAHLCVCTSAPMTQTLHMETFPEKKSLLTVYEATISAYNQRMEEFIR